MIDQDKMRALAAKLRDEYEARISITSSRYRDAVSKVPLQAANAIDALLAELEAAAADKRELLALLPGPYYMDPPDGGDVSLVEQLRRMAKDAERYRWLRDSAQPSYLMMATINESAPSLCRRELLTIDAQSWEALDQHIDSALAQRQEGS
ncbi:hypothetical protein [Burkholderia cepacia]|uniref:hypothetical protein n=1 Tax=Burkholderia cepacia TaxID=292 RepID=UPI0007580BC5|nr:hypothetical protein [Burkholderia cepacia]KWF90337.1 hypothetical protein WL95_27290 [Burkholderia cepacia]